MDLINRRNLICAVDKDAEKSFKKTVEIDRLIDILRDADDKEVSRLFLVFFNLTVYSVCIFVSMLSSSFICYIG